MRVSIYKDDPGYTKHHRNIEIYLDGEKIERCFTADEELGKVWVHDIERFKSDWAKYKYAIYDLERNITNEPILHPKELTGNVEIRVKCKTS